MMKYSRILTIILIIISSLSFSQDITDTGFQINVVQEGYYKVFVNDSMVSRHWSKNEAIQGFINQKLKNTLADVRVQFPERMRIDFEGRLSIHAQEIDTITVSRMSREIGGWLDYTNAGVEVAPLRAYLPFVGMGLIEIQTDTIYAWQKEYRLERIKKFGEVIYKELDIPFQFVADTITRQQLAASYRWQTFATEKHCIKTFIDNVYTGDDDISCTPGAIDYHGINLWRHTNTIDNLDPKTTYKIRVEGTAESGAFNYIEFEISTL